MDKYVNYVTDFSAPAFLSAARSAFSGRHGGDAAPAPGPGLQSAMDALAAILRNPGAGKDAAAVLDALDWLETLRQRLEHANRTYGALHMLETTAAMADSDGKPVSGTERREVFIWNERSIPDETAMSMIDNGMAEFSDLVAKLSPAQAAALFPDRAEMKDESEERSDG